jgi:hypothetical protein
LLRSDYSRVKLDWPGEATIYVAASSVLSSMLLPNERLLTIDPRAVPARLEREAL